VRRTDLIARSALDMGGAGVTILGTDPELSARLQQGLAAIGEEHPALRVRLLARLAIELAYDPDPARRDAISREALDLAHQINDPAAVAAALSARHVTAWGPDGCEERLRVSGEMFELAERGGDRELALQARNWRIVDLLELGDGAAVRVELDQYAELAARVRLPAFAWYVPLWRATLALLEGRLVHGIELSRRALELGRQAGDANAEVFYAEQYLERMLVQGRIRDLDPTVGGMVADVAARAISGPAWRAYRFTFAWWHAERGELNQARADYQEAVGDGLCTLPRDVNWLAALSSAVEAAVLLGDGERGTELYRLLEPYTTRMVVTARGASHSGSVAYFAARAASLSADPENADRLFAEAIRADEHLGAPALVIRDLHRHGELLHSVGQHDRAIQALSAAAELGGSLGLSPPQTDLVR
jgi:tetratricopeptide (TPR) repeat protein